MGLLKKHYNTKNSEINGKSPSISGLAITSALNAVGSKIPDVSNLVKKTDYNTKISEIEKKVADHNREKYITTPELNKFRAEIFPARLAQASLITKADFDTKLISLNEKINSNKTRHGNGEYIYFWKSKGLFDERINSITTSNYSITPSLDYLGAKIRVKFNGSCLKQDKITYNHGKIVNIHIVYEIYKNYNNSSYLTLENCLYGAVTWTKNIDIDECRYSGYGIGFDRKGTFSFGNGFGKNCIIFGVDMSFSVHIVNTKKDILVLVEDPTQEIDGTTLIAEKRYLINFTENNKKIV